MRINLLAPGRKCAGQIWGSAGFSHARMAHQCASATKGHTPSAPVTSDGSSGLEIVIGGHSVSYEAKRLKASRMPPVERLVRC